MGASVTYANGQTRTSTALDETAISAIFQQLTCNLLGVVSGLQIDGVLKQGQPGVVMSEVLGIAQGFQVTAQGVPNGTTVLGVAGGVVTLSAAATESGAQTLTFSDPAADTAVRSSWPKQGAPAWLITDDICFIRVVEEPGWYNTIPDEGVIANADGSITKVREYTRIWRVFWSAWGPNCQDRIRILKSGLVDDVGTYPLTVFNVYIQPDLPTPNYAPELEDGQWWPRTTFEALFNEQVIETINVPTVTSVELKVETASNVADLTVTRSTNLPTSGYGATTYGSGGYGTS